MAAVNNLLPVKYKHTQVSYFVASTVNGFYYSCTDPLSDLIHYIHAQSLLVKYTDTRQRNSLY